MQVIEIERQKIEYSEYVKRSAYETDYDTLIQEDTLITENGEPKILYMKLDESMTKYARQAVKNIKYHKGTRTSGLKTTSRIFGYNPRNTIRKDYCSTTSMAVEHPSEHFVICEFGKQLSELYLKYFPKVYKEHKNITFEKMNQEWVIGDTPFTSGIVNKNNPLKYHFDAGNIKDVLSNMVVFKNGVEGGYLSCPEFKIGFEVADNTVILFDGQNILHGVTPIKKNNKNSYRYSIVYYTLQQIWNCLPITQEIARARNKRYIREHKRSDGNTDLKTLARDR